MNHFRQGNPRDAGVGSNWAFASLRKKGNKKPPGRVRAVRGCSRKKRGHPRTGAAGGGRLRKKKEGKRPRGGRKGGKRSRELCACGTVRSLVGTLFGWLKMKKCRARGGKKKTQHSQNPPPRPGGGDESSVKKGAGERVYMQEGAKKVRGLGGRKKKIRQKMSPEDPRKRIRGGDQTLPPRVQLTSKRSFWLGGKNQSGGEGEKVNAGPPGCQVTRC